MLLIIPRPRSMFGTFSKFPRKNNSVHFEGSSWFVIKETRLSLAEYVIFYIEDFLLFSRLIQYIHRPSIEFIFSSLFPNLNTNHISRTFSLTRHYTFKKYIHYFEMQLHRQIQITR